MKKIKLLTLLSTLCLIGLLWKKWRNKNGFLVYPKKIDLFYATSFADLDVPKKRIQITRAFDWEFKLGPRVMSNKSTFFSEFGRPTHRTDDFYPGDENPETWLDYGYKTRC